MTSDSRMKANTVVAPRRTYNKLIANEMMEDFALRFTARRVRRWSMGWVANTALGTVAFLVLEALGGAITLSYGVPNALAAIAAVSLIVLLSGFPISYYAARYGVDIDLLSRGAGFGYLGSTIASLIYASFTFIFFALEAAVMATALQLLLGLPLVAGYIFSALVVIPLVTHGITNIGRFQQLSQPLWLLLQLVPLYFVFTHPDSGVGEWLDYTGLGSQEQAAHFDFLLFGAASAVLLSIVAQIGEQVDFLRFMSPARPGREWQWWVSVFAAGPGWIVVGAAKMVLGSFLAYLALQHGLAATEAGQPAYMYQMVFGYLTDNKTLALWLAASFVIVSQVKINVANAYAGSLAWSNWFSRITHSHPGRVVWVLFNVTIALMLMLLGVYEALERTLQIYSVLVLAWIGSIVADLVINKPLGLSPKHIEFKRSCLYDINPVGVGSMLLASVVGLLGHLSVFGDTFRAAASFVAFFLPFVTAPLIAWATGSRYYLLPQAPEPIATDSPIQEQTCSVCEMAFEPEDMHACPAYGQPICSLCCSLDVRCNNGCRTEATVSSQFRQLLSPWMPTRIMSWLWSSSGQFVMILGGLSLLVAFILMLVYVQIPLPMDEHQLLGAAFVKTFFLLTILIGVVSWLFILARSSNQAAVNESRLQTILLNQEIEAHERTAAELQKAKETAENANQAKNRYLAGISHELRTPLNILLGYAQLLKNDGTVTTDKRQFADIIHRNGEHLADLIEGLLEISKIEAGRLELERDDIPLRNFIDQIADMFRLQAESKGLTFEYVRPQNLPERVSGDKKRLRQILINLLSNAIKFTPKGNVSLQVHYRNEIASFVVRDTGIGIDQHDLDTIFVPFARVRSESTRSIPGTGLGLTISRALSHLMGGDIACRSESGKGSEFTLTLLLPRQLNTRQPVISDFSRITGYLGQPQTLLVVDDDPIQRQLVADILEPLGFVIVQAEDATSALSVLEQRKTEHPIDLALLDVLMPGINGWQLAIRIRELGYRMPIVMLSANATEADQHQLRGRYHNHYLAKPLDINQLLDTLSTFLNIDWQLRAPEPSASGQQADHPVNLQAPDSRYLNELKRWAEIGYLTAFNENLDQLEASQRCSPEFASWMRKLAAQCDFEKILSSLDTLIDEQ
ncbi:ATP-binding protein [Parathalassolituus penaei]|uniref:histidine kinase n=1 Tax=Parathalassolituus penaei TaxID=2997323 RepID=A0A9X3ECW8_9GAMM|nr:ATP-binding protein [Parathalassolituus penaei]MCY0964504.1 ATP-binding protein [Parathalassolituus penaei]